MDDLCTSCLCSGRNLYFIGETEYCQLYSQILNEIQVYDAALCVRICWECRALLRRFQLFKIQVKQSYGELLRHMQLNTPKHTLCKPPHLSIHNTSSTEYPQGEIKKEFDFEINIDNLDHIKTETIDVEHCEPETFVNGLDVETSKNTKKPPKKKAKKKIKGNKKKRKLKLEPNSDGFSDRETADQENEAETKVEESFICSECGLPFDDKTAFEMHIQKDHVKVEISKTEPKARTKIKEVLAEKPQCTECGKVFSSRKTYRYHLNVLHRGQNRYPCPRCGKVYQWKSNLGRHLRTHKARDDGELYCSTCDKRFASVATYRQHLRVSRSHVAESEFSFVCSECGKKFVNKTRLRDHVDWEHLKKIKFRCQLCDKPFKCHTSLYVHMQNVHRNKEKKDNLCHVCGKSYQNAAKLKYHIVAMHTSETPYQCGQCAAAFGWYSSLYRHIREVHYKMKVQPKKSKKGKKLTDVPAP